MKARIDSKGMLTIESESELEAYALDRWMEQNPIDMHAGSIPVRNLLFIGNTKPSTHHAESPIL